MKSSSRTHRSRMGSSSLAANSSSKPYFRAFSTGGIDTSGNTVLVQPDNEDSANGGFNPFSLPNPGAPTPGRDDAFYFGAVDFVTRVSRSHSVWYETVDAAGLPFFDASASGVTP